MVSPRWWSSRASPPLKLDSPRAAEEEKEQELLAYSLHKKDPGHAGSLLRQRPPPPHAAKRRSLAAEAEEAPPKRPTSLVDCATLTDLSRENQVPEVEIISLLGACN